MMEDRQEKMDRRRGCHVGLEEWTEGEVINAQKVSHQFVRERQTGRKEQEEISGWQ